MPETVVHTGSTKVNSRPDSGSGATYTSSSGFGEQDRTRGVKFLHKINQHKKNEWGWEETGLCLGHLIKILK